MGYLSFEHPLQLWGAFLSVSVLIHFGLVAARKVGISRAETITPRTVSLWDDLALEAARGTKGWFLLGVALSLTSQFIPLPDRASSVLNKVVMLLLMLQFGIWGSAFISAWIEASTRTNADDGGKQTTIRAIGFLTRLVLFSVLLLWALDNLGINITTLIAGLGVGGVAVALAVQNILGDLFASLTIVLDKPFVLGDFIVSGDHMGTVEYIGLKTTRVKSLSGEQLIVPNADLLQSRIRNFKRMRERRAVFQFGIEYDTPLEKVRTIPDRIKAIVESPDLKTRFDRAHFKQFGASSLDFEVVYWVLDPDFNLFMDIQQRINLELMAWFEAEGIAFAYPTQRLVFDRTDLAPRG